MELSLIKLQEPPPHRSTGERRRRIRHKLHTPVYARFSEPNAGLVLDLNELEDLSEEGFAVRRGEPFQLNQFLTFSLDLPETKAHIHGTGRVVWSDRTGRGGIQFSGLTAPSQRILKEWLMVNILVAATRNARKPQNAAIAPVVPEPVPTAQRAPVAPVFDLGRMLSAVEAVRSEVHSATDFDAALYLITDRALSLTGASGAALAFITNDRMVCRASAGQPAMPLGTAVDVKTGITGECVRTGRMVACEDTQNDGRVDQEICRVLGLGSILAAPIVADFRVVGLLEVFSPHAHSFTQVHETALDRLVELVPKAQPAVETSPPTTVREAQPVQQSDSVAPEVGEAVWEQERVAQEPLRGVPVRLAHIILLVMTLAALFLVAGYLSAPKLERLWLNWRTVSSSSADPDHKLPANPVTRAMAFDELRKLADQGDAEAQAEMASRYRNGEGVLQDDAQAAKWLERAAQQGHLSSQRALGSFYWAGKGLPRDLLKAYFWSDLAAKQGDEISAGQVQGLALQMTAAQIAAAQQQVDDWQNLHRTTSAAK